MVPFWLPIWGYPKRDHDFDSDPCRHYRNEGLGPLVSQSLLVDGLRDKRHKKVRHLLRFRAFRVYGFGFRVSGLGLRGLGFRA